MPGPENDARIREVPGYPELAEIQRNVDALRVILLDQRARLMGAEEQIKRLRESGL